MSKGVMVGHVTHFWNSMTPNISGMAKARNFKFGTKITTFGPPNISCTVKARNSNLAQRWTAVSTNEKMQNLVKRVMWGSREQFLELWDN